MLFSAPVPLLCVGVYTTDGWPGPVGKFEKYFLEVFPVLWLLSKCLYWKSVWRKMGWVYRTRLKKSVSRKQALSIAKKQGSVVISPPNSTPVATTLCIWAWKHIITRSQYIYIQYLQYIYMIVPWEQQGGGWKPSQTAKTLEITIWQRCQSKQHRSLITSISHQLSLKSFLSHKLDVFKKNPGVIWEEAMNGKNMLPVWLAFRSLKTWDWFLNLEPCSGTGCRDAPAPEPGCHKEINRVYYSFVKT